MDRLSWIDPAGVVPDAGASPSSGFERVFEPVALIATVICFLVGIVGLGLALVPTWDVRFVTPLAVVAAIEAFAFARRVPIAPSWRQLLVLLVPLLLLVRFLPYLGGSGATGGSGSLAGDVPVWWHDPGTFFTFGFIVDGVLLLGVWWLVYDCTRNLNALRLQSGELLETSSRPSQQLYEDNRAVLDHTSPLRRLAAFYLWGGVVLVIISGITAIGVQQIVSVRALTQLITFARPSTDLALANVIGYFVFGLLLLAEAQLVRQRTVWRLDHLAPPPDVAGRWLTTTLAVVILAALIALLLPTSYALTLGQLVSWVFGLLMQALLMLSAGVLFLGFLLLSPFRFLLGGGGKESASPPAIPQVMPAPAPATGSPLDAARSIIFWLVALAIVAYCLVVIWRRGRPFLARLPFGRLIIGSLDFVRGIVAGLGRIGRQAARAMATALPQVLRRAARPPTAPFRYVALGRLGPRELIEYFYLSIGERAARAGFPRRPGQTPREYGAWLSANLPLVDPELDSLTASFLEARYGPRPVDKSRVQQVRAVWQRLKLKLRAARPRP